MPNGANQRTRARAAIALRRAALLRLVSAWQADAMLPSRIRSPGALVDQPGQGGRSKICRSRSRRAELDPRGSKVELDGMTRVCTFADNQGRFAVEPRPRGTTIVWESSFRALDPAAEAEVSRLWAGMLPIVLGNLKTLIEQRRPDVPTSG